MKLSISEVENKLNQFDYHLLKKPEKNKGSRGQILEQMLGIENSSRLLDLIDGEFKSFTVGQTIAVTQIKHCLKEIIEDSVEFENSKVFEKLKKTIYVGFTRNNKFAKSKTISQENSPKHFQELAEDYGYISSKIKESYVTGKELSTTTGPNKILQIRTKASKNSNGFYTPLCYSNVQLKNKYMAFYLCSTFGKEIMYGKK